MSTTIGRNLVIGVLRQPGSALVRFILNDLKSNKIMDALRGGVDALRSYVGDWAIYALPERISSYLPTGSGDKAHLGCATFLVNRAPSAVGVIILIRSMMGASRRAAPRAVIVAEPEGPPRAFTKEELRRYDGQGGRPIYIAVKGVVFNMSSAPEFYGDGGSCVHHSAYRPLPTMFPMRARSYKVFAGRDASHGLATLSLKPEEADLPIDKLTKPQRKTLRERRLTTARLKPLSNGLPGARLGLSSFKQRAALGGSGRISTAASTRWSAGSTALSSQTSLSATMSVQPLEKPSITERAPPPCNLPMERRLVARPNHCRKCPCTSLPGCSGRR